MDRFTLKASIGYPSREAERRILRLGSQRQELFAFPPLFAAEEIVALQGRIERDIRVDDRILDYVLDLADRTRNHPQLDGGISPRGAMMVLRVARSLAWMRGRDYVVPEDVRFLAPEVLLHRLQPAAGASSSRGDILRSILDAVPVP